MCCRERERECELECERECEHEHESERERECELVWPLSASVLSCPEVATQTDIVDSDMVLPSYL